MKKLLTISIAFLLLSCNKKEEKEVNKPDNINSVQTITSNFENEKQILLSLLKKFEDKSQFFTISNSKKSDVKGKKGTIIHIVPNNLELENGVAITGDLKVELKELTNQKDLFRNNAQTVSNGNLLISGGSYYLDITSNGNKVNLKKGKTLKIEFPKFTIRNMELFYGERDSSNQMNWEITKSKFISKKTAAIDAQPDTIEVDIISSDFDDLVSYTEKGQNNIPKKDVKKVIKVNDNIYESIKINKLGWINCDAFYNKTLENLKITYTSKNDLAFTNSFIIFKDINSIMNLFSEKRTSLFSEITLPLNQKVKIISFSFKDEKFYAGEKEFTISKNNPIEINLKVVSEKEIEKLFKI